MKTAYFVLGMHRSGTSALAGVLNLIGLNLGTDLMESSKDNPKGYFENNKVQILNEKILKDNYSSWDDYNFDFNSIPFKVQQNYIKDAEKIILEEFNFVNQFAIKDPRLSLLFPIWERACTNLNIDIKVFIQHRAPMEVANSLKTRNDFKFEKSFLLWSQYFFSAEFYSRSHKRHFISFEKLIGNSSDEIAKIAKFIGKKGIDFNNALTFLEPKLKHYNLQNEKLDNVPCFINTIIESLSSKTFSVQNIDIARKEFNQLRCFFYDEKKEVDYYKIYDDRKRYKELKDDFFERLTISNNRLEVLSFENEEISLELKSLKEDVVRDKNKCQEQKDTIDAFYIEKEQLLLETDALEIKFDIAENNNRKLLEKFEKEAAHKVSEIESLEESLIKSDNAKQQLCISLKQEKEKRDLEIKELRSELDKAEGVIQKLHANLKQEEKRDLEIKELRSELDKAEDVTQKLHANLKQEEEKKVLEVKILEKSLSKSKNNEIEIQAKIKEIVVKKDQELNDLQALNQNLIKELELEKGKNSLIQSNYANQENTSKKNLLKVKSILAERITQYEDLWESKLSEELELRKQGRENFEQFHLLYSNLAPSLIKKDQSLGIVRKLGKHLSSKAVKRNLNNMPWEFIEFFDSKGYLDINPDVNTAIMEGVFNNAFEHFAYHGFTEVYQGKRKLHLNIPFYEQKRSSRTKEESFHQYYDYLKNCYFKFKKENNKSLIELNENLGAEFEDIKLIQPEASSLKVINNVKSDNEITVDIILPVYNALDDVKNCINSLYDNFSLPFNLIVVDDFSDSETENYLKDNSLVRGYKLLRNNENLRFTKTVNNGFKESFGDYVILLNSDTIVTPAWIEKIIACFNSNNKIGIVGPLSNAASWQTIPVQKDHDTNDWLVNEIPQGYTINDMNKLVEVTSLKKYPIVPSVNGFCYAIKREVINKIGTLDVEYFPTGYGEEDDFSIRAQSAGYICAVADDTYIFHAKSKSYTHEVRKVLTKGGRKSLDAKHGKDRIKQLIGDWLTEKELPQIANHIESYHKIAGKNKKVVYTAIFGNYDTIREPEYINKDWDYVCFTDNEKLTSDVFEIRFVKPIFENPTKNARMLKLLPHLFLINYEYTLWIDGNIKIRGENINNLITANFEHDLAVHKHSIRNCTFEEAKVCVSGKKDNESTLINQINTYEKQGMPRGLGLVETAQIFRKNSTDVKLLNEAWWAEVMQHSIRDQMSFNYVCWKNDYKYSVLDGSSWLDKSFQIYQHGINLPNTNDELTLIVNFNSAQDPELKVISKLREIIEKTSYGKLRIILIVNKDYELKTCSELETISKESGFNINLQRAGSKTLQKTIKNIITKYTCYIDGDVEIVNNDWLANLHVRAAADSNIALASPLILNKGYSILSSGIKLKFKDKKLNKLENIDKFVGVSQVHAITSSCFLCKTKQLNSIFSTKVESIDSDLIIEYSLKFLKKGFKVITVSESQIIKESASNLNSTLEGRLAKFKYDALNSFQL